MVNFKDIVCNKGRWLSGGGNGRGIAMRSRIRLARNIRGLPFPGRASGGQLAEVSESVLRAAVKSSAIGKNALIRRVEDLEPLDMRLLLESHFVSREFAKKPAGGVIIMGEAGAVNIMVNEEDHLRIQIMKPCMEIADAWNVADRLEAQLGGEMDFAFSERWGYLTSCPTNLGTGLRASVMLHLPALVISKRIVRVLTRMARAGIVPRGAYGEGSEPSGNLFQLSNQFTLGKTEEGIIEEIERAALEAVKEEHAARAALLESGRAAFEDRVYRAYGILKNARMISSGEAIELLSCLKLGSELGILDVDAESVDELIFDARPAHLQQIIGEELPRGERDIKRAELIRSKLSKKGMEGTDG